MDSTLKSNLSVGLPLDLAGLRGRPLRDATRSSASTTSNPYFQMIRSSWGEKLRQVFESIDDPQWDADRSAAAPLCVPSQRYETMRKITHPGEKLV